MSIETPSTPLAIANGTWKIDPAASKLEFRVKTLWGLSDVRGEFGSYNGSLTVDEHGQASGQLTIDVTSLDTENKKRDEHLRSADFFHAAVHPTLSFVSSAIDAAREGLTIRGDLHVGKKVVALELPVAVEAAGKGRVRLRTTSQVTREEVGMTWNRIAMIRGDIRLVGEVELVHDEGRR